VVKTAEKGGKNQKTPAVSSNKPADTRKGWEKRAIKKPGAQKISGHTAGDGCQYFSKRGKKIKRIVVPGEEEK